MPRSTFHLLIMFLLSGFVAAFAASETVAQQPGWTNGVVKRGPERQFSQNTDILYRPYRPFHFYGNTVRRMHYQGRALPSRQDIKMTTRMLRARPAKANRGR